MMAVIITCRECGDPLPIERVNRATYDSPARYCDKACRTRHQRRIAHHMTRARRLGSPVIERLDPIAVFERDNWRCAICYGQAPRELLGTQHPKSPTLDHRIPLRKRGHHTMDNTRCVHSQCNYHRDQSPGGRPKWMRKALARDDQTIRKEGLQG